MSDRHLDSRILTDEGLNYGAFVFVHIPRCGGTSFREFLHRTAVESGLSSGRVHIPGFGQLAEEHNLHQLSQEQLADLRKENIQLLASHDYFDANENFQLSLSEPFYFTMLRSPLDRILSHYYFFYFVHGVDGCTGKSLDGLPAQELEDLLLRFSNLEVRYLSGARHHILTESDLEVAKRNLQERFACFGLIEEIDTSMKLLRTVAPKWMKFVSKLYHVNSCPKAHQTSPGPEVRAAIEKTNFLDILLYSYAVELFNERIQSL